MVALWEGEVRLHSNLLALLDIASATSFAALELRSGAEEAFLDRNDRRNVMLMLFP
jgi:hypothetical protein